MNELALPCSSLSLFFPPFRAPSALSPFCRKRLVFLFFVETFILRRSQAFPTFSILPDLPPSSVVADFLLFPQCSSNRVLFLWGFFFPPLLNSHGPFKVTCPPLFCRSFFFFFSQHLSSLAQTPLFRADLVLRTGLLRIFSRLLYARSSPATSLIFFFSNAEEADEFPLKSFLFPPYGSVFGHWRFFFSFLLQMFL